MKATTGENYKLIQCNVFGVFYFNETLLHTAFGVSQLPCSSLAPGQGDEGVSHLLPSWGHAADAPRDPTNSADFFLWWGFP